MVGLNHQQCKIIFTERFRLSASSEITGKNHLLYPLDLPVVMLKFLFFLPVNSEEGESRKRSVDIVLHC